MHTIALLLVTPAGNVVKTGVDPEDPDLRQSFGSSNNDRLDLQYKVLTD